MRVHSLVVLIGLALVAPAIAQTSAPAGKIDPVEVRNLAASYELTNADATLKCIVTLETKPAGRGLFLAYDRTVCNPRFGFLGEVSAWVPGIAGAILLIAPDGRVVTEFTEGVGGVYEAIRENDGVYFFANLQFVDPSERVQTADLVGLWNLSRTDNPKDPPKNCAVRLTDEVAGDQLFTLRVLPECDAAIVQAGLETWQLERGDIVLRARSGEALRFEKSDMKNWIKVPEKPRPMTLSRPQ
jgi:hypothetical protein